MLCGCATGNRMRGALEAGRVRASSIVAYAFVACALGCQPTGIEAPPVDDLSEAFRAFDTPTSSLSRDNAPLVVAALGNVFDSYGLLCNWTSFDDFVCATDDPTCPTCDGLSALFALLDTVRTNVVQATADRDEVSLGRIRLNASVVRVDRRCGSGAPEDGALKAYLAFEGRRLIPSVNAQAEGCREGSGGGASIDGALNVWFGAEPFLLRDLGTMLFLVGLRGEVSRLERSASVDILLRTTFAEGAPVSFRIPFEEGFLTATYAREGFFVEAANGRFVCDFDAGTCTRIETLKAEIATE